LEFDCRDRGVRCSGRVHAGGCSLSEKIVVQYVSFEAKLLLREYTFAVREASGDLREYKVTIENEAFVSRKVRYQDGAYVCCLRLHRELAEAANHPAASRFSITDTELADYKTATAPKPMRSFQMNRKDD
jgi:hypothetical protein